MNQKPKYPGIKCSFCGKSADTVAKLITGPSGAHLRRMRRDVQRDPARGQEQNARRPRPRHAPHAPGDEGLHRPVRDRPGRREKGRVRRGVQPFQAHTVAHSARRRRRGNREKQHPAHRPHRHGQDASSPRPWRSCSRCRLPSSTPRCTPKRAMWARTWKTCSSASCRWRTTKLPKRKRGSFT